MVKSCVELCMPLQPSLAAGTSMKGHWLVFWRHVAFDAFEWLELDCRAGRTLPRQALSPELIDFWSRRTAAGGLCTWFEGIEPVRWSHMDRYTTFIALSPDNFPRKSYSLQIVQRPLILQQSDIRVLLRRDYDDDDANDDAENADDNANDNTENTDDNPPSGRSFWWKVVRRKILTLLLSIWELWE